MTKLEQLQEMEKRMDSMTLKQQDAVFDDARLYVYKNGSKEENDDFYKYVNGDVV